MESQSSVFSTIEQVLDRKISEGKMSLEEKNTILSVHRALEEHIVTDDLGKPDTMSDLPTITASITRNARVLYTPAASERNLLQSTKHPPKPTLVHAFEVELIEIQPSIGGAPRETLPRRLWCRYSTLAGLCKSLPPRAKKSLPKFPGKLLRHSTRALRQRQHSLNAWLASLTTLIAWSIQETGGAPGAAVSAAATTDGGSDTVLSLLDVWDQWTAEVEDGQSRFAELEEFLDKQGGEAEVDEDYESEAESAAASETGGGSGSSSRDGHDGSTGPGGAAPHLLAPRPAAEEWTPKSDVADHSSRAQGGGGGGVSPEMDHQGVPAPPAAPTPLKLAPHLSATTNTAAAAAVRSLAPPPDPETEIPAAVETGAAEQDPGGVPQATTVAAVSGVVIVTKGGGAVGALEAEGAEQEHRQQQKQQQQEEGLEHELRPQGEEEEEEEEEEIVEAVLIERSASTFLRKDMPGVVMYLKARGLGKHYGALSRFGVVSVEDMLDERVLQREDLQEEIHMTPEEIEAFYSDPPRPPINSSSSSASSSSAPVSDPLLRPLAVDSSSEDAAAGVSEAEDFLRRSSVASPPSFLAEPPSPATSAAPPPPPSSSSPPARAAPRPLPSTKGKTLPLPPRRPSGACAPRPGASRFRPKFGRGSLGGAGAGGGGDDESFDLGLSEVVRVEDHGAFDESSSSDEDDEEDDDGSEAGVEDWLVDEAGTSEHAQEPQPLQQQQQLPPKRFPRRHEGGQLFQGAEPGVLSTERSSSPTPTGVVAAVSPRPNAPPPASPAAVPMSPPNKPRQILL